MTADATLDSAPFSAQSSERSSEFEWRDKPGTGHVNRNAERIARGLGWFSVGLGVAGVAAPRRLAHLIGVEDSNDNRTALRAIGLRELASGVGILSQRKPTGWLWARVGGDAIDLALLSRAIRPDNPRRDRTGLVAAAVVGIAALDLFTSQQYTRGEGATAGKQDQAIRIQECITVNRPIEEVYEFWRDFRNLPRFMGRLLSVQPIGEQRWHLVVKGPAGAAVEWDLEIVQDVPNEVIAWRSLGSQQGGSGGSIRFVAAPGGRGTEVHLRMMLDLPVPGGRLAMTIGKLLGKDPAQQVRNDLRRFKQIMETGEVVHSDASIYPGMHPAQPPADLNAPEIRRGLVGNMNRM
jgi:uncharacterized membrane protein